MGDKWEWRAEGRAGEVEELEWKRSKEKQGAGRGMLVRLQVELPQGTVARWKLR